VLSVFFEGRVMAVERDAPMNSTLLLIFIYLSFLWVVVALERRCAEEHVSAGSAETEDLLTPYLPLLTSVIILIVNKLLSLSLSLSLSPTCHPYPPLLTPISHFSPRQADLQVS
jgi:hypothetical protein